MIFLRKRDDGSAPAARLCRGVFEIDYKRSARKNRANDFSLNANALAVNDADPANVATVSFFEVVFDHSANLARRDRMKIKDVSKLNGYGIGERVERVERFCL